MEFSKIFSLLFFFLFSYINLKSKYVDSLVITIWYMLRSQVAGPRMPVQHTHNLSTFGITIGAFFRTATDPYSSLGINQLIFRKNKNGTTFRTPMLMAWGISDERLSGNITGHFLAASGFLKLISWSLRIRSFQRTQGA